MGIGDLLLLSVALAMDCFTVSIVIGVIQRRRNWGLIMWIAFLFGFFQAMMPLIGWLCTSHFASYIESYDHWIAFGLLAFLGCKMIAESNKVEDQQHLSPEKLSTQVLLAVATSIDALAIGISMAVMGYESVTSLVLPLVLIGVGSFVFSVTGHLLGIRFGNGIRKRLRPELLGGIILLFIGFKILLTHLLE